MRAVCHLVQPSYGLNQKTGIYCGALFNAKEVILGGFLLVGRKGTLFARFL